MVWFRLIPHYRLPGVMCTAVLVAVCGLVLRSDGADAQYRAGTFVDGRPVFAGRNRKPAQRSPGLRSVQRLRADVRRRQAQSRRSAKVRDEGRRAALRLEAAKREASKREAARRQARLSLVRQRIASERLRRDQLNRQRVAAAARAARQGEPVKPWRVAPGQTNQVMPAASPVERPVRVAMPLPPRAPDPGRAEVPGRALPGAAVDRRQTSPAPSVSEPQPGGRLVSTPPRPRQRPPVRKPVMQVVVSLSQQQLTVYYDSRPISSSRVSSGKAGHRTPTGIFSIIQKRRYHRSNIYSGAPMPFMQRITWSGIALHLGHVPGYPASHGCIRLPAAYAKRLFRTTEIRTHVVIADDNPMPRPFAHANLPGASNLGEQKLAVLTGAARHPASPARAHLETISWRGGSAAAKQRPGLWSNDAARDVAAIRELVELLHFDQSEYLAHRNRVAAMRAQAPLRILVTRMTAGDEMRAVQRQLMALGFDVGGVDGLLGRETVAAIRAFQGANRLKASGILDEPTRVLLKQRPGGGAAAEGMVYVRQNGRDIYSGAVEIANLDQPVGQHLFVLAGLDADGETKGWTALTLQAQGRLPSWTREQWRRKQSEIAPMSAHDAISRVTFPRHVRDAIEDLLTPGSSLIIADRGSERETGLQTDFIVLAD